MLKLFGRGMIFGAGMLVVSMTGSMLWSGWIVARWRETTQHLVPDTSPAGIRASLQQEVDAYNARLAQLSSPDVTAMGKTLSGETLTTRFMMNRFVAPGERPLLVQRLRAQTVRETCNAGRFPALRAGYRFVTSYADIVGGEIRFVMTAADCTGA